MTEKRADTRMLCSELVDIHWKDCTGRQRSALANLEDISGSGVCLQMDGPVIVCIARSATSWECSSHRGASGRRRRTSRSTCSICGIWLCGAPSAR